MIFTPGYLTALKVAASKSNHDYIIHHKRLSFASHWFSSYRAVFLSAKSKKRN